MKKSVRVLIKGTVQGVFFRQFVKENADNLGLMGFARNLDNGDVEVVAEGDANDVEKMISVLKKGPEHAMIKNVSVEERKWGGNLGGFRVLRGF